MTDEEIKAMELLENIKNNNWTTLYIMSSHSKDADILLNLIQKQQEELEKKDKVIDEMALWLYEDDTSFGYGNLKEINTQEKIKEYFYKKVEGK